MNSLVITRTGTHLTIQDFGRFHYQHLGVSPSGAMDQRIIKELENRPREVYCGSIGYFDLNNDMDTNICIRTIMICDNELYFAAGGGIVYDLSLIHI